MQTERDGYVSRELNQGIAQQILFYSYFISQGSDFLQRAVMNYLHVLNPTWIIEDDWKPNLVNSTLINLQKLIGKGLHQQPKKNVEVEIVLTVDEMQKIFNGTFYDYSNKQAILEKITLGIVELDYKHLIAVSNRRPKTLNNNILGNPHLSTIVISCLRRTKPVLQKLITCLRKLNRM
jgi:hypothetical protein